MAEYLLVLHQESKWKGLRYKQWWEVTTADGTFVSCHKHVLDAMKSLPKGSYVLA